MIRGLPSFVPFHRTILRASMPADEVRAAIAEVTSTKVAWFGSSPDGSRFRGEVGPRSFRIVRRIRYRNSFLPVVFGALETELAGTVIHLRMRMHAFVVGVMGIWMTGATIGALAGVAAAFNAREPRGLLALGMPLFGAALAGFGFRYEANIAIDELSALLRATESDPPR